MVQSNSIKNTHKHWAIALTMGTTSFFSFSMNAQCLEGNCENGNGKFRYNDNSQYQGAFKRGNPHGKGKISFANGSVYEGDWAEGNREGKGTFTMPEGHVYIGDFRKNRFSGIGKMRYPTEDQYEGEWQNDQPNGKGIYTFKGGDRYDGEFRDGKFNGRGVMNYRNGSRYEGFWSQNFRHGEGKLTQANGKIEQGTWENGKLLTPSVSIEKDENGSEKPRNCNKEYCREGRGEFRYGDGSRWVGEFKDGDPRGEGTCYYTNGDRYVGQFEKHAPHGRGFMYFANGRVLGAIWEYGRAIGDLPANDKVITTQVEVDKDPAVKIWAVVVGVGRYTAMPVLKYSDDDAYQFYAFLKSPEGGALPDRQIKVLVDDDATRANILQTMRQVLLRADENDVIVFYFSGHGVEGSFLPVDYDGFNNRLSHTDVRNLLNESKAKHKICFADACHSGAILAMKNAIEMENALKKYYNAFNDTQGGMALFMSSKAQEYSLEDQGLRSGIFSHYLIRGLKGEADSNKNKIVTIKELFEYVFKNVKSYTAGAQTPIMSGAYDNNMPVSVIR